MDPAHTGSKINAVVLFLIALLCLMAGGDRPGWAQGTVTPGKRVALVMGNDAYARIPLQNATNDARAMASALEDLDFTVDLALDVSLRSFERSVGAFASRLAPGDVGLFYFAGHGIQIAGENYLLPVDFDAKDEIDAKYDAYSASRLLDKLDAGDARLKIVILDACRDNPFRPNRSGQRGLAQMTSGEGTFIAFATAPGKTASDNPRGRNGLFTSHLLETLAPPGLKLEEVFSRTRQGVYAASGRDQLPWTSSSVIGDFFFQAAIEIPAAPPDVPGSEAYSQFEQLAARRQQWSEFQSQMQQAFDKVVDLDGSTHLQPSEKLQAWQRFLNDFGSDNPFGQEDERLRREASARQAHWQGQGTTDRPGGNVALDENDVKAVKRYRQACKAGSARDCSRLGAMYAYGHGVTENDSKAVELFRQACDAGYAQGCSNLGNMYENGHGVLENDSRAVKLFRQACDAGYARGCSNLGAMYANGYGVTENDSKAAELFRQACDAGHARGCNNLGFMYGYGHGLAEDAHKAVAMYRLACDRGDPLGCTNLGRRYRSGKGVGKSTTRAQEYFRKGCDGGDKSACRQLDGQ